MMIYTCEYESLLGTITLAGEDEFLIGLWFNGQRHFGNTLLKEYRHGDLAVLSKTKEWLDIYFAGGVPGFTPEVKYNSTPFRKLVCDIMLSIPYGCTTTYGEIAQLAAKKCGRLKMSAQAVGGAVGYNPISLIIPCHRVIGKNGNLTGYGGGIERKIQLLKIEKVDTSRLYVPKKQINC